MNFVQRNISALVIRPAQWPQTGHRVINPSGAKQKIKGPVNGSIMGRGPDHFLEFLNMRNLLPLAIIAGALAAPATAAGPLVEEKVTEVRIDLEAYDLSSDADRAVLERRINAQLRKACTSQAAFPYGGKTDRLDEKCFTDARREAMAQVEAAALAASTNTQEVAAS